MTSRIHTITFDCHDPLGLAEFWREVLGYIDDPADPNKPGDPEAYLIDARGRGPALLFQPVGEGKTVKNRLHMDLRPEDLRDLEVDRVQALGGQILADHRDTDGGGWVVFADPEGNEFCICRSDTERVDTPPAPQAEGRMPPALRTMGDRPLLEAMLDWYRAAVVAKVAGVKHHLAVATPLGSPTSIAGLVKHLALVEDSWFAADLAGEPEADWYRDVDWDVDPDWEFHTVAHEPLALQVERYEAACARARAITERFELDDVQTDPQGKELTLRWVLVHLIEETARHLGHLDILRELLDGATGD